MGPSYGSPRVQESRVVRGPETPGTLSDDVPSLDASGPGAEPRCRPRRYSGRRDLTWTLSGSRRTRVGALSVPYVIRDAPFSPGGLSVPSSTDSEVNRLFVTTSWTVHSRESVRWVSGSLMEEGE